MKDFNQSVNLFIGKYVESVSKVHRSMQSNLLPCVTSIISSSFKLGGIESIFKNRIYNVTFMEQEVIAIIDHKYI